MRKDDIGRKTRTTKIECFIENPTLMTRRKIIEPSLPHPPNTKPINSRPGSLSSFAKNSMILLPNFMAIIVSCKSFEKLVFAGWARQINLSRMPVFLKLGKTTLIPFYMQKIETSQVVYLVGGKRLKRTMLKENKK